MPTITQATAADSSSILDITAAAGNFDAVEVSCVQELWSAYLNSGEASGYVFLVCRDEHG